MASISPQLHELSKSRLIKKKKQPTVHLHNGPHDEIDLFDHQISALLVGGGGGGGGHQPPDK